MARKTHRVAVVVFCEAEGVDEHDAGMGAQMAVDHALYGGKFGAVGSVRVGADGLKPAHVGFVRRDGVEIMATVHEVMEAGTAIGNGYLWTSVTSKAFPRRTRDE